MRLLVLVLAGAASAFAAPPAAPTGGPPYLTPPQILKLMEDSPRHYQVTGEPKPFAQWTQQNAMIAWPETRPLLPMPAFETHPDGSRSLVPFQRTDEVAALVDKVEVLFEAKDWAAADKGYAEILAKFPDEYGIQLDWGDAALFAGKPEVALARYEKATKLNPADHRSWYYRGNALAALGRKKEAIDAWVRAIAMRPENTIMLTGLEQKANALSYVVRPRSMMPGARVTTVSADTFQVTSGKQPHWMGWGLCKAMWRGEPAHRKAMTGSEKDTFSIEEEKECLGTLAGVYDSRKKGEPDDPVVDQLLAAMKGRLITGYLIYEIASRMDPHVFLIQDPGVQKQVEDYVRRFVLVPKS